MKSFFKCVCLTCFLSCVFLFSSCGVVYSALYGYGSYGGGYDYLLDPGYAVAQVNAQQNAYNQTQAALINKSIQDAAAQENEDYEFFCRYNRKSDGSKFTKAEYRVMVAQALMEINYEYSNGSYDEDNSNEDVNDIVKKNREFYENRYGEKNCPSCKGTGECSTCDGTGLQKGFGLDRLPCANCYKRDGVPTGYCGRCRGTGKTYGLKI